VSNLLEYKGYYGTVEFSAADKVLFGKVLGIKGLISYEGDSVQNLKADFEGAVNDYLEMCAENSVERENITDDASGVLMEAVLESVAFQGLFAN